MLLDPIVKNPNLEFYQTYTYKKMLIESPTPTLKRDNYVLPIYSLEQTWCANLCTLLTPATIP